MALTASPEDQRTLLDLQAADTRIRQIAHRAANLPQAQRIGELDDSLVHLDQTVLERLGASDDLQTEISRIAGDVTVVEARVARDRERLAGSVDAKSATALEHEVDSLERRRVELEDIELEVMERLEAAEAQLAAARSAAQSARDEREGLARERDAEAARIRGELDEAEDARAAIAATVPEALLALYDRQRERYGIGASLLQRRMSTASGVELTAAELRDVQQAAPDAVLLCPNSSAILVRTEESGL